MCFSSSFFKNSFFFFFFCGSRFYCRTLQWLCRTCCRRCSLASPLLNPQDLGCHWPLGPAQTLHGSRHWAAQRSQGRSCFTTQFISSMPPPRGWPSTKISLGVIWLFWLIYIWNVLWVHNAPCHRQPVHVLTPVYISSQNNSRVTSVCFVFWGSKGMEIVPKTSWQHRCLLRSQSKIGTITGVHGTDLVWGCESLPVAKRTHSWTCSLCLSRTELTKGILLTSVNQNWTLRKLKYIMIIHICQKLPSRRQKSSPWMAIPLNWMLYAPSFLFYLFSSAYAGGFFLLQSAGKPFLRSFKSLSNFLSLRSYSTWS